LRKTLNSCTASCVKFVVVLPQIASSRSPPSMTVDQPFRWSADPPNFVGLKNWTRLLSGADPGSSCASSRKLRPSDGSVLTWLESTTDESSAFATSTVGEFPLTRTDSCTAATASLKSNVAAAPTMSAIVCFIGVKPESSAVSSYGPGGSATAR
jgi:hypothetical protein